PCSFACPRACLRYAPSFFFFHFSLHLRDLHSFPTRRSSDLTAVCFIILFIISFVFVKQIYGFFESGIVFELTITSPGDTIWIYLDRKSTRLNSSHVSISYAVFCLKKKKTGPQPSM